MYNAPFPIARDKKDYLTFFYQTPKPAMDALLKSVIVVHRVVTLESVLFLKVAFLTS